MAPDAAIRSAFVARLTAFPGLPSVAWENMRFTPVLGSPYVRPTLMPGEPTQAEIGENGCNRHVGVYQISLFFPAGKGLAAVEALRDGLVDHFKRGSVLTGSIGVEITKAYGGPMLEEPNWIHCPVTIQYRVLASN